MNMESGSCFCVSESMRQEVYRIKVSHENAVICSAEFLAAVSALCGYLSSQIVCRDIFFQEGKRLGIDFHRMDIPSRKCGREREVADSGKHIRNFLAGLHQASDAKLFSAVSLREHNPRRVKSVGNTRLAEGYLVRRAVEHADFRNPHHTGLTG